MKYALLTMLVFLAGCKTDIDRFYEAEGAYKNYLQNIVKEKYSSNAKLVVVEYALKRSPDGIESDIERYVYVAAIDKNSIPNTTNPEWQQISDSEGIDIKEVDLYYGIFQVPNEGFNPNMFSFGVRHAVLNNKWAELVEP